jgi:hypothetical protein
MRIIVVQKPTIMKNHIYLIWGILFSLPAQAQISDSIYHERIYIGTGEYNPFPNWHGILRFEDAMNYNSGPTCDSTYTPDATIPVKACSTGTMFMNFEHGFYVDETNDRMYVASLFTNPANILTTNPDTAKGSIAIFDNISTLDGGQIPTRHIYGDSTGLRQPHGCWLDESRDMLYVANSFGCNILVFHNASTRDGNTAPDRIISWGSLATPVYIFIDEVNDRMFVACSGIGCGGQPKVAIYNSASTINGVIQPLVTIQGSNTRLGYRNPTVHNVWYNSSNGLLAVGHHTHELLMFDLNTISLIPGSPVTHNLAPRVIMINDDPSLADTSDHNLYGFYWDEERDMMYCSDGISGMGGAPMIGSPPNVLKIFEHVSDTSVHGVTIPDRTICWTNGDVYFPPQPIWVQKTLEVVGLEETFVPQFQLFPNPAFDYCMIELPFAVKNKQVNILNSLGQVVGAYLINGTQLKINTETWPKGIFIVQMDGFGSRQLVKQ